MRLTFVHLSDIHFTKFSGDQYDLDTELRDALAHDVVTLTSDFDYPTTGILVTGDIAFSGSVKEYHAARTWLEHLCGLLSVDRANVWLTPGNHDVNRQVANKSHGLRALHESIRTADKNDVTGVLQTLYRNEVDAHCLFSPLNAYNDFARSFGCEIGPARPVWKTEEQLDDGLSLQMWGLNSVIVSNEDDRCRSHDTTGSLVLGAFQIPLSSDKVVHMTLCHHPPDWFKDEHEIARRLRRHVTIQLFGHTHSQQLTADAKSLRLVAGAVHPKRGHEDWTPAYNVLTLTVDPGLAAKELIVTVWPRVWDSGASRFICNMQDGGLYHETRLTLSDNVTTASSHSESIAPVVVPENAGFSTVSGRIDTAMPPERSIAFRYIALPYQQRLEIAHELSLLADSDEDLADAERYRRVLGRVSERGLWKNLLARVAAAEDAAA